MMFTRLSRTHLLVALATILALAFVALDRSGMVPGVRPAAVTLYQWLVLLGGTALLLGVVNVAWLHLRRIQSGQGEWLLSLILVAVLLAVFTVGIVSPQGGAAPLAEWVFDALIAPGQAALFALLAFFLAAAAFRYLRVGRPGGAWMLVGALLVLLTQLPVAYDWLPVPVAEATFWLLHAPVAAAVRGVLIGGVLALLVAVLRLLIGKT